MATETATPPAKEITKPSLADSFRQGADPENKTGKNPQKVVAEAEQVKAPEVKSPVSEPAKPLIEGDPDAGIKAAVRTNDKETNLANLRKKAEDAERRAIELETKLRETESRIPADYDQVRKEREELMTALERTNIEESPRFKDKYDKPQQSLISSIKKTLSNTEANADEFAQLVQLPESRERTKALSDAIEGLDRISQGKISAAVQDFDQLRDARSEELKAPHATYQTMRQEQENVSRKQREENSKVMDQTLEHARSAFPWFKPIEGNDAWNARVSEVERQAKSFWTESHSPAELAQVTIAGTMAPMLTQALTIAQKENDRLNEELEQYRTGTPKTGAGAGTSETKNGAELPKAGGALEAFRRGAGNRTR